MEFFEVVFPENKKVDIKLGDFLIKTDQSKENEGDETAPEPFALFLAGLAACAGLYAKTFCDIRELDTKGMTLTLVPYFEEGQKLMEKIKLTLNVNQAFPEKYIKAVIKAMNTCPVKNQLNPEIKIETGVTYL